MNGARVCTRRGILAGASALAATPVFAQVTAWQRPGVVVPGTVIQALEGIEFGPDGTLYGTSVHAQAVYRIDVTTGAVGVEVPSPSGESDDVAVGPAATPADGVLAWTAQTTGEVRIRKRGGPVEVILPNAPRVNPIAFNRQGRLFTAQSGAGDNELWELDVTGVRPPKIVKRGMRLNGFGFGSDGRLYAPHFGTSRLVAIDIDSGDHAVIADDVGSPGAAKVDGNGNVISADYKTGEIWKTDPDANTSRIVARVREPVDNLAIASDGTVYLSNVADSAIYALNAETGVWRTVVPGWFTVPLGMATATLEGRAMLLVADPFGFRYVDPVTGEVFRPHWANNRGASSSVAMAGNKIAYAYGPSGRVRILDRATDTLTADVTDIKSPRGLAMAGNMLVLTAR
ncbi:MAG: hypothetical protein KDE14_06755 [Rhodobacteraceae bacterium]|nr:hypothetical protein [Paracoccaceae bacterium]